MTLLQTQNLSAFYGDFQALFDINVTVEQGETVAIIGANGAGKTTFLRAVAGALADRAATWCVFEGRADRPPHARTISCGSALPWRRKDAGCFQASRWKKTCCSAATASVRARGISNASTSCFRGCTNCVISPATVLSGGQQQMTTVGRALMSNPRLLLCDELSLGLAPVVIRDIYRLPREITAEGTTVVLVEQDINRALDASARFYCFQEGRLALTAPTKGFDRAAISAAYFGM